MKHFAFILAATTLLSVSIETNVAKGQHCATCATPPVYAAYRPMQQVAYQPAAYGAYTGYSPRYTAYRAPLGGWYPGKRLTEWLASRKTPRSRGYYQPVTRSVPVTSYQPVTSCDPCSGNAITTYRPITAWATQTCYLPTRPAFRPLLYRPLLARPAAYYPQAAPQYASYAAPSACNSCNPCGNGYGNVSTFSNSCSDCSSGISTFDSSSDSGFRSPSNSSIDNTPQPTFSAPGPTDASGSGTRSTVRKITEEEYNGKAPTEEKEPAGVESTGFDVPRLNSANDRTALWGNAKVRTADYRKKVQPKFASQIRKSIVPTPTKRSDQIKWRSVKKKSTRVAAKGVLATKTTTAKQIAPTKKVEWRSVKRSR